MSRTSGSRHASTVHPQASEQRFFCHMPVEMLVQHVRHLSAQRRASHALSDPASHVRHGREALDSCTTAGRSQNSSRSSAWWPSAWSSSRALCAHVRAVSSRPSAAPEPAWSRGSAERALPQRHGSRGRTPEMARDRRTRPSPRPIAYGVPPTTPPWARRPPRPRRRPCPPCPPCHP